MGHKTSGVQRPRHFNFIILYLSVSHRFETTRHPPSPV
jgi:hypothetical protein